MRAIPIGQRVRARLAAVAAAAAVLVAAVACTTATTGPGQSSSQSSSQGPSRGQGTGLVVATAGGTVRGKAVAAAAESAGQAFAAKAGCASDTVPAQTAACLRRLPVATILADQNPVGYSPDIDGAVLTQSVKTALASGRFNRVPVMIGTNHDEYRLFVAGAQLLGQKVTAANYQSVIGSTLGVPAATAATTASR
jgi:para-nitrobenzyl esterase